MTYLKNVTSLKDARRPFCSFLFIVKRLHPGADLSQNGNYGGRFLPRFVSACESTEIAGEAAEIVP